MSNRIHCVLFLISLFITIECLELLFFGDFIRTNVVMNLQMCWTNKTLFLVLLQNSSIHMEFLRRSILLKLMPVSADYSFWSCLSEYHPGMTTLGYVYHPFWGWVITEWHIEVAGVWKTLIIIVPLVKHLKAAVTANSSFLSIVLAAPSYLAVTESCLSYLKVLVWRQLKETSRKTF